MNDRVFCSSTCRLESAAWGGPALAEHARAAGAQDDRVRKRSVSKVSASLDTVGEEADGATVEQATRGGSFFAYVGQLSSWLSADAFV
jgi:hypothetical protein